VSAPSPLLSTVDVTKRYGALVVLDEVSFELGPGEALGVVGPNGAGKTTLLDVLAGAGRPDRGVVTFSGREVTRLSATARCRLGIGRTHQIPRPFVDMTVFENVLVGAIQGGGLRGAAAQERAIEALRATGMLGLGNRRADTLGLLDRKRLELARAVATGPSVLLLDEIAGGLTEAEAHELVETIRGIHHDGTTIVWIEHVLHALVPVISRLVVLNFGRKLAEGPPRAVLDSPLVREIYLGIDDEVPA
jgi:branched-chain amino acid transport system ATP-binding protein